MSKEDMACLWFQVLEISAGPFRLAEAEEGGFFRVSNEEAQRQFTLSTCMFGGRVSMLVRHMTFGLRMKALLLFSVL
jgi:hypothetical protein